MKNKSLIIDPIAFIYFSLLMIGLVFFILYCEKSSVPPEIQAKIRYYNSMVFEPNSWIEPHLPSSEEIYEKVKEEEQRLRDEALPEDSPLRDPDYC